MSCRAINGKLWDITVDREEFFDPFKCRQKCKEFGEKYLKMNVRVCGICVAVCPLLVNARKLDLVN